MTYADARERLRSITGNALLNTDDDGAVMLLYPMTVTDFERGAQPLLGVMADGDLVALAQHRCDLAALRAEVVRLRHLNITVPAVLSALQFVLDLIDKHAREGQ